MKHQKKWLAAVAVSVLTACGGGGGSTTNPQISNIAPSANAGSIQNILVSSLVTLDGSASSDANGDTLTYRWTLTSKPSGSSAALSSSSSARPTFSADLAGTYVATLIVNDGQVDSTAATVTVTAISPSITLYSVLSGSDWLETLPYSSSGSTSKSCLGSCPSGVTVDTFKLVATGRNYTISGLSAENVSTGSSVVPSFSGLANNQVISSGQTVTFNLQSGLTGGTTVNLRYSFTISETGQTFTYNVGLRTN